ncbi:MAG: formate dehydrogenase accessory sulfurtransferase FdhD [Acidimicrobiales bacterium]
MEIRLDDHIVTTTMRTPGHDYELAVGFCVTEGLLAGAPVRSVRYCATGSADSTRYNVVTVSTGGCVPAPQTRLRTATSSCGLCGSASLDALRQRLEPLPGEPVAVDMEAMAEAAAQTRARQPLFDATGSIHAASTFDPASGAVDLVREDIGRHNAVDKVVGRLHLDGRLPARKSGLFVSGRASFEIVQKAWAAGFAMIAAVSGPSALALETARAANLVLVGFVRLDGRGRTTANQYAPEPRFSTQVAG